MIPATSLSHYITGLPALSVPDKSGFVADWHLLEAFAGRKPLPVAGVNFPSTHHLFGSQGIDERGDSLRGTGVRGTGAIYVANAPRAIADLLHRSVLEQRDLNWLSLEQYQLPGDLLDELRALIQILDSHLPSEVLRSWIAKQLTTA